MALTDAGRLLFERARRALRELDAARLAIRPTPGAVSGVVNLGLLPSSCELLAGPLVGALQRRYPQIRVSLSVGYTDLADIGFFAIDPRRSDGIGFTAPYVLIEGAYLVRQDSAFTDNADVAAGVRQQLESDATRLGGLRLLPGRFMVIEQAMGLPLTRGASATALLAGFVERAKASGHVAQSLARHGIRGAVVAPAAR